MALLTHSGQSTEEWGEGELVSSHTWAWKYGWSLGPYYWAQCNAHLPIFANLTPGMAFTENLAIKGDFWWWKNGWMEAPRLTPATQRIAPVLQGPAENWARLWTQENTALPCLLLLANEKWFIATRTKQEFFMLMHQNPAVCPFYPKLLP